MNKSNHFFQTKRSVSDRIRTVICVNKFKKITAEVPFNSNTVVSRGGIKTLIYDYDSVGDKEISCDVQS